MKTKTSVVIIIKEPYTNTYSRHQKALANYRCMIDNCKRVELSHEKIVMHLAVEHGVRPLKNLEILK